MTQRWLSWTTTFDIETDQMKLGTVHRKFFSLSPVRYDFYDYAENLQAYATMRWFSWGATFDVADAKDQPIGTVEQRIFTFFPTFDIISPQGHILATAKMNFWGTTYSIKDPVSQEEMATLWRPFLRLKDNWLVTLTNPELYAQRQIDPRLFILVMAFQTDREAWAAERERRRRALDSMESNFMTEAQFAKADSWVTEQLELADVEPQDEEERIESGFALIEPNLETLPESDQKAVLDLFRELRQQ